MHKVILQKEAKATSVYFPEQRWKCPWELNLGFVLHQSSGRSGHPVWSWKNCPYRGVGCVCGWGCFQTGRVGIQTLAVCSSCSEESYNVTEYSLREQLLVLPCAGEEPSSSPARSAAGMLHRASASHLFRLLLLCNHAGDRGEMLLGAETP